MEDIKVTVWCAAYNHEKYIRSALEGFVMQKTNFKYEVIIHDDASTDNTAKIIREYELKYPEIIKPIYQTENQYQQGKGLLVNYLFPNAKGKYIAFCEGDDYWTDETKLQLQFDYMEKTDCSLCVHKVQCCNEDNSYNATVIPEQQYQLNKDTTIAPIEMAKFLFHKAGYPFHTSSFFMKRELMVGSLYKEISLYMNGDAAYLRAAMECGNIGYIDRVMSHRRLLTIGNWNNRYLKSSEQKKIDYQMRTIQGEQLFDDLTNGRFHNDIVYAIYVRFLFLFKHYSSERILNAFKEFKKQNHFPLKISFRTTLAYLMFSISPSLYRLVAKILK